MTKDSEQEELQLVEFCTCRHCKPCKDTIHKLITHRERYALSKQIEENQRWVNIYQRVLEKIENVGGNGSMTWQAVKLNILDHEERVADLKAQLSKLMEKKV